ncbi:MAG: PAS domain-containing protein, partial [Comamonadaceae bacterium]
MKSFAVPAKHLTDLGAGVLGNLLSAAADLALILDADGIVRDVAWGGDNLDGEGCEQWVGKPWIDTVSKEARAKAEALLRDADAHAKPVWRQVVHRAGKGADLPLLCAVLKFRDTARLRAVGRSVVFARDLRGMTALQQSVVDAQQEALHDQWKLRDAQSRYRQLFQTVSDAVLIVDASSLKIAEANPAAHQLFGDSVRKLVGGSFPLGLEARSTPSIQAFLGELRSAGRAEDIQVQLADGGGEVIVSGSVFRQENGVLLVVRLSRVASAVQPAAAAPVRSDSNAVLLKLVQSAPDGVVV